ncbi:hypothetical protein [Streptomyces sp. 2231.1]|uniref:hypothetical protein n=1 Tax=Streptomyces sp. 2231.1 TaxID=1855347 RepID=UPI00115FA1C7|nr:hypothetical protein [Streptomyces sp. 2231.1]
MSIEEVATTMGAQGFTRTPCIHDRPHGALVRRAGCPFPTAPPYEEALTVCCRTFGELAAVAVDAWCGPQACTEELGLVGQVPTEGTAQLQEDARDRGMPPAVCVEGDGRSGGTRAAGTGPAGRGHPAVEAFFVAGFHNWACMVPDCVLADEWDMR